jgi:hypothetical protein
VASKSGLKLLLLFAVAVWLDSSGEAKAQPNPAADKSPYRATVTGSSEVDRLTDEIIKDQVDLLRLNARMRLQQLLNPWQNRGWFLANLGNGSLTAVGAYINGFGRYSYLHKHRLREAPRDLVEHAAWLRILANLETCGAAATENMVLWSKDQRNRRHHTDLRSLHGDALVLQTRIDNALSKRSALAAALTGMERQRADAETAVLQDMRNLAAGEFARFYADSRADLATNYLGYSLSFGINAIAGTGGIVGNHATMENHGTAHYRTRLAGTSGITDIIASAISLTAPWDLRYAGRWVARREYRKACAELHCVPVALDDFHRHVNDYHELVSQKGESPEPALLAHDHVYAVAAAVFDKHRVVELGLRRPSRLRFDSQLIVTNSTAPTKMSNGIGSTIGAFKYTSNPHERFEAIGGPAIAYGSGYSLATAELLRNQFWWELTEAKKRKLGTTRRQVFTRELEQLSEIGSK